MIGFPRVSTIVATTIIVVFVGAFFAMGWVRYPKHHADYPSQIDTLANKRRKLDQQAIQLDRGQTVYTHYCQICHGAEGKGQGFNSTALAVPPRNFSDAKFWQTTTDERVFFAISQGGSSVGKSVLMPAWGRTLDEQQIRDVIAYLRTVPERVQQAEAAESEAEEAEAEESEAEVAE